MTLEKAQIGRRTCDHYFAVYYRILCAYIYNSRKQSVPCLKGKKGQWVIIYTQQWKHNSGDMRGRHTANKTVQLTFDSEVDTAEGGRNETKNVDWVNFWLPFRRNISCRVCLCRFSLQSKRAMNMKRSDSFKVPFNCTLLCTWLRKLFEFINICVMEEVVKKYKS